MDVSSLRDRRLAVIVGATVLIGGLGLWLTTSGMQARSSVADGPGDENAATDWQEVALTDVNDNTSFTIAGLEKPVLIESFAVWCSTCTRQQQEIQQYLADGGDARVVSLNVDPNEDAAAVRQHTDRYGFDWRYAVAPSGMTRQLIDRFGQDIVSPPLVPKILVCEDGVRRLDNGVKTAETLGTMIQQGC